MSDIKINPKQPVPEVNPEKKPNQPEKENAPEPGFEEELEKQKEGLMDGSQRLYSHLAMTALALIFLIGCANAPTATREKFTILQMATGKGFIQESLTPSKKWVWFAPTLLEGGKEFKDFGMPSHTQHTWMMDYFYANGINVVGMDVGDAYGSPDGRAGFTEFYAELQKKGFEPHGCMILQSRGGLHGYMWILEHPGVISCVFGIYPLVALNDYGGPSLIAPIYGMSIPDFIAALPVMNPINRTAELTGLNIFHKHGDLDHTVNYDVDQRFIDDIKTTGGAAEIAIVPNQGHEWYSKEFFEAQDGMDFIMENLR